MLYIPSSSRDHGTLGHFRSLLSRLSVKKEPKNSVDATIDFLMTVYKGHLLACACRILGIKTPTDRIDIPEYILKGSQLQQQAYVNEIAVEVVEQATLVWEAYQGEGFQDAESDDDGEDEYEFPESGDGKYNYARVLCHFCALVMNFLDAWAEGDGERMLAGWRFFLLQLYASHRTKYALEALRLQFQVKAVLSPHLAHHIMWDRFVNKDGGLGKNIPCDLFNEHVNRLIKEVILHMGPNLTENALQRVARSVTMLEAICKRFDSESGVFLGTHTHSTKSDIEDVKKVAKVVLDDNLFICKRGRKHRKFSAMRTHGNPLWNLNWEKMKEWVENKKKQFSKFNTAGEESDPDTTTDDEDEDE